MNSAAVEVRTDRLLGVSNAILSGQAEYVALGRLPDVRQSAYRGLFDSVADSDELALLRCALQTGTPLGNARFKMEIEATLDLKVGYARRGRPRMEDPSLLGKSKFGQT